MLSEQRDKFFRELNDMLDMVLEIKDDGQIVYVSSSSLNLIGYSPEDLIGTSIFDFVHTDDLPFVKQQYQKVAGLKGGIRFNYRCRHKHGFYIWVNTLVNAFKEDVNQFQVYIFEGRKLSDSDKMDEEMQYLSLHDPMTGLYNRLYFEEAMTRFGSGRFDPIGIIVADIDGLKITNDTIGYDAGDRIIKKVSKLLLANFRSSDIVARIDGDEFVVIMPDCSESAWEEIVNRISRTQDSPQQTEDGVPIKITVGYALRTHIKKPLTEVLREADAMMYKRKAEKRIN